MPGLGDSKPSKLMDSMLALMGSHNHVFSSDIYSFSNFLRVPIAQSKIEDYRTLSQEADMIYLAGKSHSQNIQEVNTPTIRQNTTKPNSMHPIMNNMCWYHHQHGTRAKKCLSGCKHYSCHIRRGPLHQQLLITDSNSGCCFLIDTGAQVSVIPATGSENNFLQPINYKQPTIHPLQHMGLLMQHSI